MYVFYVHVHNNDMYDFPLESMNSMKLNLFFIFFINYTKFL